MELPGELMELLSARRGEIESLELTYRNGGKVNGTIHRFRASPFKLVIRKTILQPGERPRHRAQPGHLTGFRVILADGSIFDYS